MKRSVTPGLRSNPRQRPESGATKGAAEGASLQRVFRKGMDVYESEGPKCDLERKLHLWRREVTEWERGLRRTEQSLGTQENDQVGQKAHDPSQLQGVEKEVA